MKPTLGEHWYVQLKTGVSVWRAVVTDITVNTVELGEWNERRMRRDVHPIRYVRDEVRFVERVQEDDE